MEPDDFQKLIDAAAKGDRKARSRLCLLTKGQFKGKRSDDIPPSIRGAYDEPDRYLPKSLDELRAKREYDVKVVDEFVDRACDESYLSPGATMMMFVLMCTQHHSAFSSFGGEIRMKLMSMYRFWDESHPWVRANILYKMRERLYHQHHQIFCQAFAAKARQYDKICKEAKLLEAQDVRE